LPGSEAAAEIEAEQGRAGQGRASSTGAAAQGNVLIGVGAPVLLSRLC
jgi:hypothetical protein